MAPEHRQGEVGPISKLVRFFCPDVEISEEIGGEYCWYLLSDWDTQINRKSTSDNHPWLVKLDFTPGGFSRWGRSTTRSGNPPEKLIHKSHTHFGCNINETGWVQVADPEIRGAHLLSRAAGRCEENDPDWLKSFELCQGQVNVNSLRNFMEK